MNKYEKALDRRAKMIMKNWNLEDFKKSHPTLFIVIIETMMDINNNEEWNTPESFKEENYTDQDKLDDMKRGSTFGMK